MDRQINLALNGQIDQFGLGWIDHVRSWIDQITASWMGRQVDEFGFGWIDKKVNRGLERWIDKLKFIQINREIS